MKKPQAAAGRLAIVALCLTALFGLSSCLDVETNLRLRGNGSVEAEITYRLAAEAAGFGRGFGADEPWPFPLTEKDFRQRELAFAGTDVKRYRNGTDPDGSEWIRVSLESDSVESLAAYLGMDLTAERSEGNGGRMTMVLPPGPSWSETGPEAREALDVSASGSSFVFQFRPPRRPSDAGIGFIDGRRAVFETNLSDLLSADSETEWTVVW